MKITDSTSLSFSDIMPAECDMFGPFAESIFFGKSDSGLAVFIDYRWLMLDEAEFLGKFAKEDSLLGCCAQSDDVVTVRGQI